MAVFFTSRQSPLPTISTAIEECLLLDPKTLGNAQQEAARRTLKVSQELSPAFNPWRFAGAAVASAALLGAAIWTGQHDLPDISKTLMTSFTAFSGIVLGLLGGEAQKSVSG